MDHAGQVRVAETSGTRDESPSLAPGSKARPRKKNGRGEVPRRRKISRVACTEQECQVIMQKNTQSSETSARCFSLGYGKAGQKCVAAVLVMMQARLPRSIAVERCMAPFCNTCARSK